MDETNQKDEGGGLPSLEYACEVAQKVARLAGEEIRDAFSGNGKKNSKDDDGRTGNNNSSNDTNTNNNDDDDDDEVTMKTSTTDLVTKTDKKCEAIIIEQLQKHFPTHKIIGEESSSSDRYQLTNDPTWTIDPIDGTTNFVHRLKLCCVLISYIINKQVLVGITYDPMADEMFWAIKGKGAFLVTTNNTTTETTTGTTTTTTKEATSGERTDTNGSTTSSSTATSHNTKNTTITTQIHVSKTTSIQNATISMDAGYGRDCIAVDRFLSTQRSILLRGIRNIRVVGCTGLNMAYVACGRLDGGFEEGSWEHNHGPKIWDFAPGKLLIEEAGGITIDLYNDQNITTQQQQQQQQQQTQKQSTAIAAIGKDTIELQSSPSLNLLGRSFFCTATSSLAKELIQCINESRIKQQEQSTSNDDNNNKKQGEEKYNNNKSSTSSSTSSNQIPKRKRIEFFNGEHGKRIRLSNDGHIVLQTAFPQQRCLLCLMKTSCMCEKCNVPLCRFRFSGGMSGNKKDEDTCWEKHHRIDILERKDRDWLGRTSSTSTTSHSAKRSVSSSSSSTTTSNNYFNTS